MDDFLILIAVLGVPAIIIMCVRIISRLGILEKKIDDLQQRDKTKTSRIAPTPDIVNRALKSNGVREDGYP